MATGILSKGITLTVGATVLTDLQEMPEIGGSPEQVEVTTLDDSAKRNINGIKDYGDLVFKFLYDNTAESSYRVLQGLEASETLNSCVLELPDKTKFAFDGYVSVKIDSAAVNDALTFTATFTLNSDIDITHPTV